MPPAAGNNLLSEASNYYLMESVAPSTKKAYASGAKLFRQFCLQAGLSSFSPCERTLEYFVSHCAKAIGLSYATIRLYLCGIRHECLLRGQGDVLRDKPRLELCMRGIKKTQPPIARVRRPITTAVLYSLARVLKARQSDRDQAMLWAALCVGFYGALRCGEFTVSGNFNPASHLCYGDVKFNTESASGQEYVNLHLKTSKTDPFHYGCDILLTATGQVACPVASLKQYLKLSPPRPSDYPLFHLVDGSPLTRSHYVKLLQDSLQSAGYSGAEFNGHSLRKGFATSASAGKIPDHVISAMGRWSSDCYKIYINTPFSVISNAQRVVADPGIAVDK
jgi:integrase